MNRELVLLRLKLTGLLLLYAATAGLAAHGCAVSTGGPWLLWFMACWFVLDAAVSDLRPPIAEV